VQRRSSANSRASVGVDRFLPLCTADTFPLAHRDTFHLCAFVQDGPKVTRGEAEPQQLSMSSGQASNNNNNMWVLLVIAGVIGSCSAEVVLPVLPGLLPTLALGHKHVHGHGRQLQVSSAGCSNATATAWETCQNNAPAPDTDDLCTNLKAFEAGFTCDVNNIFDCANLKAVNDALYGPGFNLCLSDNKVTFASAPNLCPGVTFPNMAKVMAKACPVLTTAEQCSVSLNGCLSASELALIAKATNGISLDGCTASTVLEKFFKCTSAAPSCAATSSATCSQSGLTSSVLSAAEKKCALTMTNVRSSCNLKSDAGGVASLAASVVLAAAAVVVVA
jgi:hypothetical protein